MKKLFCLTLMISLVGFFTSCEETVVRETTKFVGEYGGEEACGLLDTTLDIEISESSTVDDRILIRNNTDDYTANATVSGNTYTINDESVTVNGTLVEMSGSGTIQGDTLINGSVTYSFVGGAEEICTWELSKR